jgi:hypothetical protein
MNVSGDFQWQHSNDFYLKYFITAIIDSSDSESSFRPSNENLLINGMKINLEHLKQSEP